MNCIKRLRGFTALIISLLIVFCAVGFGNDVLADGTSDSVSFRSIWPNGATVDVSGSGYQPNSTFTVTINFNLTVAVDNYWNAGSATSNGTSVTMTVTTKADGTYSCGMNLSGDGFTQNDDAGNVYLSYTGCSSTGSAAKAEPAAPKPEENKPAAPKPGDNKPADPKKDENKPAAPKPEENKPADPKEEKKPDEKKAEEPKAAEPKAAEPAKQDQNNNNNNDNSSKNTATSTPTAAPTKAQDSSSSSSSNSGNSGSSATAAPTKTASADDAVTTTAPKTTDAPSSDNSSEKKTDANTTETSSKTETDPTETTEETEAEVTEETEPSEPATVENEEPEAVAVVIEDGTDETGEPTPTPTAPIKVNGIITPHGGRKKDGMSWWAFILIILGIGVGVRLAVLKSQGVDNSELALEFIPLGAIKNKFKKDSAPVVEQKKEDEPKVVNGYLKKSDTAAIRPMYSNAASGSASRVRGGTKQTPRVDGPSTATGKVTTNRVSSNPTRKTTSTSSSSSSNTAFNHAQAMKELRAMEEAEKNGR